MTVSSANIVSKILLEGEDGSSKHLVNQANAYPYLDILDNILVTFCNLPKLS
jgi:hypothetical protein